MGSTPEIFFSYAWDDEAQQGEGREKLVNELYASLLADGYRLVRDKYDLGYKGFISDFMKRIGEGNAVIVAVSEKYVRSPYCMFELYEIARNSNFDKQQFREKVLPVMVEPVDFTNPDIISEVFSDWKLSYEKWATLVKDWADELSDEQSKRFNRIKKIRQNIGELIDWIADMNTFTPKVLSAKDFSEIKQELARMAAKLRPNPQLPTPTNQAVKEINKFLGGRPFFTEIFIGREEDLKAVHQKLFEGNNFLLLVNGEGGIGKTTLAAQYYRKYEDAYQHLAWVYVITNLSAALLTLALPLDVNFPETMPNEERISALLDELRNLEKPCLLVIDNANELKDLEANYTALRSCTNFHLLLTTRITEFEQALTHRIEPLEKAKAVELFKKYYAGHKPDEKDLLEKILAAVGYNTLVIELLAKNLASSNKLRTHYSLAQLLQDLQEKGLLALSHTNPVSTPYQAKGISLRKENPEAIIEAMYELSGLAKEEAALLSVFAVLPAENIPFEILETIVPNEDLEGLLLLLTQKGWLDYHERAKAFKVSPVIQEIIKKKNPQLLDDCRGVLNSLIDKLDYESGTGHFLNCSYGEATIFARYAASFLGVLQQDDEGIAILCERVGSYSETTGSLLQALTYYERDAQLSKKLYTANPQNVSLKYGLAISYERLGKTQAALGNLSRALAYYEDETKLFEELYEVHPQNADLKNGLAISYEKLGKTQAALGNLSRALAYYEDETKLFEELYEAHPQNADLKNGLAISYSKLGETQAALGNLGQALTYYEKRSRLGKELYEAYPQNVGFKNGLAISYSMLGETQAALGNLGQALSYYEVFNRLGKELYEAYPQNVGFKNGLAVSFSKLGETQAALGNLNQSLTYYEERSRLGKELYEAYPQNLSFKNGLAVSYSRLGQTQVALGNLEQALVYYKDYNRLGKELYEASPQNVDFKNGLAISYQNLGNTQTALGNLEQALEYYQNYSRLEKELYEAYPQNVGFKNGLAVSYEKLGQAQADLGNLEQALVYYKDETKLFEELYEAHPQNVGFKSGLAISFIKLGSIFRQKDEAEKAKSYYRMAEKHWVELVTKSPVHAEFKKYLQIIRTTLTEMDRV